MSLHQCPGGYDDFEECRDNYFDNDYCSDAQCPYSDDRVRKSIKGQLPHKFKDPVMQVRFVCGEYNTVYHYSEPVTKKEIEKDFQDWKQSVCDEHWEVLHNESLLVTNT